MEKLLRKLEPWYELYVNFQLLSRLRSEGGLTGAQVKGLRMKTVITTEQVEDIRKILWSTICQVKHDKSEPTQKQVQYVSHHVNRSCKSSKTLSKFKRTSFSDKS